MRELSGEFFLPRGDISCSGCTLRCSVLSITGATAAQCVVRHHEMHMERSVRQEPQIAGAPMNPGYKNQLLRMSWRGWECDGGRPMFSVEGRKDRFFLDDTAKLAELEFQTVSDRYQLMKELLEDGTFMNEASHTRKIVELVGIPDAVAWCPGDRSEIRELIRNDRSLRLLRNKPATVFYVRPGDRPLNGWQVPPLAQISIQGKLWECDVNDVKVIAKAVKK